MVIGVAAIVISAIFFLVPFLFSFVIASIDRTPGEPAAVHLASALRPARQPRRGLGSTRLSDGHRLHQQHNSHCGQRRRPGHLQRDGRLHLAAPSQPAEPGGQHPGAGRPDRATRHRSHHLGPADAGPVQNHARSDPDRDRLRTAVLHLAVPRLHRRRCHGSWTRPPWSTGPDPSRSSSG